MSDAMIGIERLDGLAQVTVKADLDHAPLHTALGPAVPTALRVTAMNGVRLVWMAPDEILAVAAGAAAPMVAAANAALAGTHAMVLDVSDARAVLRLTGGRVGEVLAKGAPCDCSDHGFSPGTARRTHLGGLAVAIWRLDAETWEIACFRSYAHHLEAWLAEAARPGTEVYSGA